MLRVGHHLCARLFIPDRAIHGVDGWPSPSLLSSCCILLLPTPTPTPTLPLFPALSPPRPPRPPIPPPLGVRSSFSLP